MGGALQCIMKILRSPLQINVNFISRKSGEYSFHALELRQVTAYLGDKLIMVSNLTIKVAGK